MQPMPLAMRGHSERLDARLVEDLHGGRQATSTAATEHIQGSEVMLTKRKWSGLSLQTGRNKTRRGTAETPKVGAKTLAQFDGEQLRLLSQITRAKRDGGGVPANWFSESQ